MRFERASGVLLHPTSLPGPYGIGDLGPSAFQFIDWLADSGCKLWQVLPLGPTGYGDSPYQCFSAFAGNPYLISPDFLLRDDLLHPDDLREIPDFPRNEVDFGRLIPWKLNLLERAFIRFKSVPSTSLGTGPSTVLRTGPSTSLTRADDTGAGGTGPSTVLRTGPSTSLTRADDTGAGRTGPSTTLRAGPSTSLRASYEHFCAENVAWLQDYALFMALKEAHGGGAWGGWPEALRKRDHDSLAEAGQRHADAVERYAFYQFVFHRQWTALREHAHQRGIQIIGDIPIFVAYDSADVWANPDIYFLDQAGRPTVVAGVPPDYFSRTGQLWGNPLYRWEALKATDYGWWIARFRATLRQVDIVRLDHFRGFAGYWEIPAGSKTAEKGRWVPGPGEGLLSAVKAALGELPIIAEDLGEITPDVIALRDQFDLPGMKILQFAFSGPDNKFLPHNYPANCVAYTGTHDNDTSRGWYESAPEHERNFADRYLACQPGEGSDPSVPPQGRPSQRFARELVRAAWASVAVYAIAPMQDLLGLGTEARMNFPSTLGGNWRWRLEASALSDGLADWLRELNYLYLR